MIGHNLDSQAFSLPATDVERFELAALYTLQHRLSRHAEAQARFQHRQVARGRVFDEARAELVGHADTPGGAGSELFADAAAGGEPAKQRPPPDPQDLTSLPDGR